MDALDDVLDTPSLHAVNRHRRMDIVERAPERGSAVHLSGRGGDELLGGGSRPRAPGVRPSPADGLATCLRIHREAPVAAPAPPAPADRPALVRHLAAAGGHRLGPPATGRECAHVHVGHPPPRLPPRATAEAVEAVREEIRRQAAQTQSLGDGHSVHRELAGTHSVARFAQHVRQMSEPLGIAFTVPYYDDRLVETALAVRDGERVTPWRHKPLIAEATRGVVPEASRGRTTKTHGARGGNGAAGPHRPSLLALCENPRPARLGLIDPDTLRQWCLRPLAADMESALLHPAIGCEVWLRSREKPRPQPAATERSHPLGITLRPGGVAAETEYGTALLDQSSGEHCTLNPTAALIMHTVLDGTPREQTVEQFAAAYGISVREAGEDFTRIVDELHSARLPAS